jgi:ATP adenylyltransferase
VWRGVHVFVVMNLYPYNSGHLLVVPYRQVAAYDALTTAKTHVIPSAMRTVYDELRAAARNDAAPSETAAPSEA